MKIVNVCGLKNNPSEALRYFREDLVLVMNGNEPDVSTLKKAEITIMQENVHAF